MTNIVEARAWSWFTVQWVTYLSLWCARLYAVWVLTSATLNTAHVLLIIMLFLVHLDIPETPGTSQLDTDERQAMRELAKRGW
ncbi:MAG: hypothetical protein HC828_11345, partial [Blastochloris sp.]|nr:hypothetical protein [Blastochloris sp.]